MYVCTYYVYTYVCVTQIIILSYIIYIRSTWLITLYTEVNDTPGDGKHGMDESTKGTVTAINSSEKTSEGQTLGDDEVDFHGQTSDNDEVDFHGQASGDDEVDFHGETFDDDEVDFQFKKPASLPSDMKVMC